jgi:TRAP-type C4-dicarboxylate transport system permease small subunit
MVLPSIGTVARFLEKRASLPFSVLGALSAAGLFAMVMITVVDAFGRRFFSAPIYGSYESVTLLLSIVIFSSLSYCTVRKGHFSIDVVTSRFSPRIRLYIVTVMYLMSALICWLMTWQIVVLSMSMRSKNLTGTELTFLPLYPFGLFGAFCFIVVGWIFLVQFINFLAELSNRDN